jgi:hypothetical protein
VRAGDSPNFYLEASVYAVLHHNAEALDRLEESVNARELPVEQMKYQEFLADVHREPRFIALERRVGLDP